MGVHTVAMSSFTVDMDDPALSQLEEKVGEPLTEAQRTYLLTGEEIQMSIKQDEIAAQRARIKELNEKVHAGQDSLDATSEKVDLAVNKYIASGKQDLSKAKNHADAIRKKKRIILVIVILCLIAAGIILYFLLK